MKTASPIRSFNLRPDRRSRLSLRVEIYRTTTEFRAVTRGEDLKYSKRASRTRGLAAECLGVTERTKRTKRLTGLFAIIRIPKPHLTTSTITHEAFHATMRWARRAGIQDVPTDIPEKDRWKRNASIEERCAIIHGEICRKIVLQCYRFKLITN